MQTSTSTYDETTKVVKLVSKKKEKDNYVTIYLNESEEMLGIDFKINDFTVNSQVQDGIWLYSNVICPNFAEASYIMPFIHGEITDLNKKNIIVSKSFKYKSDKSVNFVLDSEGNPLILE